MAKGINKHSKEWLSESEWGKHALRVDLLNHAIELLEESDYKVSLVRSDETGELRTAILPAEVTTDFWLDSFKTKKEALEFCKEMGWVVV
jgi:hypothetical protein